LEEKITACTDLNTLEDLYLPYKRKRRTKGDMAKEKGLEPLADLVWAQDTTQGNPNEYAAKFADEEMEVTDTDEATEGARHIVAERINESAEVREKLRD